MKRLVNLANCEPFAKIFLANIHRYMEMYMAYTLTVAYSPNSSSPIACTCKVSPAKYFPCMVSERHLILSKNVKLKTSTNSANRDQITKL